MEAFVRKGYDIPWSETLDVCPWGAKNGYCGGVHNAFSEQLCPRSCNSCWKTAEGTQALLLFSTFCVSTGPQCLATSRCGEYIESTEACEHALMQLPLVKNMSATKIYSLADERAPKGCLIDSELRGFFNSAGSQYSKYAGLKSVCSVRSKSGVAPAPVAATPAAAASLRMRLLLY